MKLLLTLASLLFLALSGCIGPGGPAFVGFASVAGNGDARTDSDVFLALGDLQGDAGLFMKGSGFPLTFPLNTREDEWVAVRRSTKETVRGKLGVDPLPSWCADLFRPGELETLSNRLGYPVLVLPAG